MGNVKHIAIAVGVSVLLLGIIAFYIGKSTGEVSLLSKTGDTKTATDQLPGPVTAENKTAQNDANNPASTTHNTQPNTMDSNSKKENPIAVFHTNKGDITLELFADAMPITVANFVKLAESKFYDSTKFHRVIENFMIQGGDPNSKGTDSATYGAGGPGYTIQDEFIKDPRLTNVRGTIAMANTGQPNSGGSQFFINLVDNTGLDFDKPPTTSSHPVFGKVINGMDIVDTIGKTKTGPRDLPVDPIIITSLEIKK